MLTHRLSDHFHSLQFVPNSQRVAVAVRPAPDGGGVFAILKIEHCIDLRQAEWIADRASIDVRVLLGVRPTDDVVDKHCYRETGASGWSAAIGVELADRSNAEAFAAVIAAYASPGPNKVLN